MDMGEFVAEIRKRECLWNRKKVPLSADQRKICDQLWKDVGKTCNISKETAKSKWRSLRDHFLKLLKKVPVYISGETYYIEESEKPNWQHFNNLMFLLNAYKPKQAVIDIKADSIIDIRSSSDSGSSSDEGKPPSEGENSTPQVAPPNHNSTPADNTFQSIKKVYTLEKDNATNIGVVEIKEEEKSERIACDETRIPFVDIPPPLAKIKPQVTDTSFTSIKRVYTLEETDDLDFSIRTNEQYKCPSKKIALESNVNHNDLKANVEYGDENENLTFFRSLIPFMKKLDPVQQLRVRMRCQESLLDELGALNN